MRDACLAPGKRLRPALCLAGADAVRGDAEAALEGACALEMVHAFSLIHDDLPAIDNDELRRGRPTCWKAFGEAVAILAGDALFSMAFDVVAGAPAEPARVLRALRILSAASNRLVEGETVDILAEGQEVDAATLEFIHRRKTGALIAASCEIGGLLGGGSDDQVEALRAFGTEVGLAFQIADDLLNETSTPEQLGKATGSDRERGKATYPALYGLEASRQAARDAVDRSLADLDGLPGDTEFLRGLALFSIERVR